MDIKDYSIEEHIHRFAVWTAARAASRGRLKNTEVEDLIKRVKLRESVNILSQNQHLDDTHYREWIKAMGNQMCSILAEMKLGDYKTKYFCFGLAAKIISIYIKTVEVLPTKGQFLLSKTAYPPIDSILLKNLNARYDLNLKTTWSKFGWDEYEVIINQLNVLFLSENKWKIKVEWKVSNEEDSTVNESVLIKSN